MNSNDRQPEHFISVWVQREPETINRLTGLLRRRGFVMEGISAGKVRKGDLQRLTVHVRGDERCIDQVQRQIRKISETIQVTALDPGHHVRSELALIRIRCPEGGRGSLADLIEEFRGRIVDAGRRTVIVEIAGEPKRIECFMARLGADMVVDMASSGIVAMDAASKKAKTMRLGGAL